MDAFKSETIFYTLPHTLCVFLCSRLECWMCCLEIVTVGLQQFVLCVVGFTWSKKKDSNQEDFKHFKKDIFSQHDLTVAFVKFCNLFLCYLKVPFFSLLFLISAPPGCAPRRFLIVCVLHLFTHSCASPCFRVSCLSPEMFHRILYTLSQKTCFTGGLLDQRNSRFSEVAVESVTKLRIKWYTHSWTSELWCLLSDMWHAGSHTAADLKIPRRATATFHPPSVPMRSRVFHIQSVLCRQLWQDDAWGASCEGCALVTPQLDFGFHKASPLFALTGCAGYWPGKSAQDGLSCKEKGGWWCMGSFWDLSWNCCWRYLAMPLSTVLCSFFSFFSLSISLPQSRLRAHPVQSAVFLSRIAPMPFPPAQSLGSFIIIVTGVMCVGGCRDLWLLHLNEPH